MRLLTEGNPKVGRGAGAAGFHVAALHLAPAMMSGANLCPWSTEGCRDGCLNRAGRGRMERTQAARVRRSRFFLEARALFLEQLDLEIAGLERRAARCGLRPAVRLNATSDVAWERVAPSLFRDHPDVTFWDYTKSPERAMRAASEPWPENYDLTFSWSGSNGSDCVAVLLAGGRVAVPFRGRPPVGSSIAWTGGSTWRPSTDSHVVAHPSLPLWPVVDGDATDLRFLDSGGVVVGLKAKGPAKSDASGWVLDL